MGKIPQFYKIGVKSEAGRSPKHSTDQLKEPTREIFELQKIATINCRRSKTSLHFLHLCGPFSLKIYFINEHQIVFLYFSGLIPDVLNKCFLRNRSSFLRLVYVKVFSKAPQLAQYFSTMSLTLNIQQDKQIVERKAEDNPKVCMWWVNSKRDNILYNLSYILCLNIIK